MVHILGGNLSVLEASSVYSNAVPQLIKNEYYVLLCLLSIMRIVIWTTRQREFYGGEKCFSVLILFFKQTLKVTISKGGSTRHQNSAKGGSGKLR